VRFLTLHHIGSNSAADKIKLKMSTKNTTSAGTLHDYKTGEAIRPATAAELAASIEAAKTDGGAGVITVDGKSCYVQE
jgi:hypothetical protein